MDITRFDVIEFDVLNCGKNGGFYREEERSTRAKIFMDEGIFLFNPEDQWIISGWKLSDKGLAYYDAFMQKLDNRHGHVWMTNHESNPDIYDADEYGNQRNIFAMSYGYHNGPKCKNCGYEFCQHCDSEFEVSECKKRG